MEDKYQKLDKIEEFFDGDLSKEELEQALKGEDFQEEAHFFQAMTDLLKEEGKVQMNEILADVDIESVNPDLRTQLTAQNERLAAPKEAKVRQLRPMRRVLAIAASVLVLVVAGTLWYLNSSPSNVALAEQNYLEADLPGTMSGSTTKYNEIFQSGLEAFSAKSDLELAKINFEQIVPSSNKYAEAQYFLGHINFQQENFEAAITNYQTALSNENLPNYVNRDKLNWNLLLAQLGSGEDINIELEKLIANANSPIDQMARELKEKL